MPYIAKTNISFQKRVIEPGEVVADDYFPEETLERLLKGGALQEGGEVVKKAEEKPADDKSEDDKSGEAKPHNKRHRRHKNKDEESA